jgi:NAD(P)-dependent dehydrogenase (short-subunit alcohol dehydrogenase family)
MKDFSGKVAAVTGAASGMGRELAIALARRGAHLALSDVNAVALEESVALARAANPAVTVTQAPVDTSKQEEVNAWAEATARAHGKVNLIFNNAGVGLSAPLASVKASDFAWIMGINFWGVVWGTQAFLPHLKASGEGHVINTSSLFGLIATPFNGPYNASKFAVRGYTEALRMELELEGSPVSATCVHPGGVRTNIARDARIDASVGAATGVDVEIARSRFDKMLHRTSAASAAQQILRAVETNQRRVLVGSDAKLLDTVVRVLGSWYQPLVVASTRRFGRR